MTTRLHNYAEVRAYLGKEHLDWLRAFTPGLNAPADYWPQKVLAASSMSAAMQNYVRKDACVTTATDLLSYGSETESSQGFTAGAVKG